MSNSDRPRKLFVRSMLAGTTTLSTLMGAQSLALIDSQSAMGDLAETASQELTQMPTLATLPTTTAPEAMPTQSVAVRATEMPEPTLFKAKPSITIFRQPGSTGNTSNTTQANHDNQNTVSVQVATNNTRTIQPPQPVELQPPEPVVVVKDPIVIVKPAPQPQPQPQQQSQAKKSSSSKKSRSGSSR